MTGWHRPVASFWSGGDLSFVEQAVILSYHEHDADFTLFVDGPVDGIPAGTRVRPASDLMARPRWLPDVPDRKALAVWSDYLRLRLIAQGFLWVDMDAYCVRPFGVAGPHVFGENGEGQILSGVLALPPDSPALVQMTAMLDAPAVIPPGRPQLWVNRRRAAGRLGPLDLPWGETGPRSLTRFLQQSGESRCAQPAPVFYPVFRTTLPRLWMRGVPDDAIVAPETLSVHLFGFTKRVMATHHGGLPPAGSWLDRMARRHGLDPRDAPARAEALP